MAAKCTNMSSNDPLPTNTAKVDQLEREISRLVEQLKEVTKMNTYWQRYDSQREEHVLELTRDKQELQDKVSDLQRQVEELSICKRLEIQNGKPRLKEEKRQRGDADNGTSRELSATPTSSAMRKEEEIAALTDHIAKLKDIIIELEKEKKKNTEELTLLREQVNICVEDFNQERKDRERIHGENLRLIKRLEQTEQQVMKNEEQMYVYQEQIKRLQERCHLRPVPRQPPLEDYEEPYCCCPENMRKVPVQTRQTYRHPMYFGDDLLDLPGDVEVDGASDEPQDEN